MLSKKMTFSLMSLITLLALAFAVPSAMAAPFEIKVMGPTKANYGDPATGAIEVRVKVLSGQPIADLVYMPGATVTETDDIMVNAFDKDGFGVALTGINVTVVDLPKADADDADADIYAMKTPKEHQLLVTITPVLIGEMPDIAKVTISIKGGIMSTDVTLAAADAKSKADVVRHTITLSMAADRTNLPKVVSIQRLRPGSQSVVAAFQENIVTDWRFDVRIVLTEHPNGPDPLNAANLVEVENGTVEDLVVGTTFAQVGMGGSTLLPHPSEGMYEYVTGAAPTLGLPVPTGTPVDFVPAPTSSDSMYRQYRVTIYPHQRKGDSSKTFDVKIKVKNFHDNESPIRNTYISPGFGESVNMPNGREILTVKVAYTEVARKAGYRVTIPEKIRIPGGGYLVIVQNEAGSEVVVPAGSKKDPPKRSERTPAQMQYNVIEAPTLPNLATQFVSGVVVDVEAGRGHQLLITEVMWGEDTSLNTASNSQYIELYNPGEDYVTINDKPETLGLDEALTLVFYAPNEFDDIPIGGEFQEAFVVDQKGQVLADISEWWGDVWVERADTLPWFVSDRIGTLDSTGAYWSPATKGQSGRSGTQIGELTTGRGPFEPPVAIVSMYRVMDADGKVEEGQMEASWASSVSPKSANFNPLAIGIRHGTPGAATDAIETPADTEAEAKAKADKDAAAAKKTESTGTYPKAGEGLVYISEIMVAGDGILPQWIEISNGDRAAEYNLSGWTLTVANAAADADVSVGALATFTIPDGTTIDPSERHDPIGANTPSTILVVTEVGRNNLDASGQVINLMKDNEVDLINAGVTKRKYTLLSDMAFSITLAPPEPKATKPPKDETAAAKAIRSAAETKDKAERKAATDMVGNLGADGAAAWALPMSEDDRSSLIRRHVQVKFGPAEPEDGTMMDNWVLASDTQTKSIRAETYYGAQNDVGTPGFRAGGALPVELSHFRPARDKVTDAVVITWSTQSELNNAGFFIKRSQQRDGEFKVINATMVQGAGTTSEKQFYTYNDSTAQPNVVYYYQIEDVSLDGNRQTLTNGIRLKGHVSVAGKLTTLWGDLKTLQ